LRGMSRQQAMGNIRISDPGFRGRDHHNAA
jgi:hypothetical protein